MKETYLEVPYNYKDKEGHYHTVYFFIPKSWIRKGDLTNIRLQPDNFCGVNLKAILNVKK